MASSCLNRSCLKKLLVSKKFTCVAEVLPPKESYISEEYFNELDRLVMNGAQVFSVASNPMGTIRMESGYVAQMIQKRFESWDIPSIVHVTCVGRSLLQHQSHLLSLYHSGQRNLLIIAGDEPKYCPGSSKCMDIDSLQFIQLVKQQLANGLNSCHGSIGEAMEFTVGCAVNMQVKNQKDVDWQTSRLNAKVQAGVDFCMTQPIFDLEVMQKFLDEYERRYGLLTTPILTGVLPIRSMNHVRSLEKIPGILDPISLQSGYFQSLQSLAGKSDEEFSQASYGYTANLVQDIQTIHPYVKGMYVTAGTSLQSNDMAIQLIRQFSR